MSNPTIKGKNIETSNVCFADEPKVLDNGAKYVWLGYNKKNLVVQTPVMSLPFGLNLYDKAEYPKYSVELSFSGKESNSSEILEGKMPETYEIPSRFRNIEFSLDNEDPST